MFVGLQFQEGLLKWSRFWQEGWGMLYVILFAIAKAAMIAATVFVLVLRRAVAEWNGEHP